MVNRVLTYDDYLKIKHDFPGYKIIMESGMIPGRYALESARFVAFDESAEIISKSAITNAGNFYQLMRDPSGVLWVGGPNCKKMESCFRDKGMNYIVVRSVGNLMKYDYDANSYSYCMKQFLKYI